MEKLTHSQLCDKAERWLKVQHHFETCGHSPGCGIVLKEMVSIAGEQPDCIGFSSGVSTLIECKTSRSDFFADQKKIFRRKPETGMGNLRFFLTPENLIKPEKLPEKWGLLETDGKQIKIIKEPEWFGSKEARLAEYPLLISALRRK